MNDTLYRQSLPPLAPVPVASPVDAVADALCERGWWYGSGLLETPLCHALRSELLELAACEVLNPAGIGRGSDHALARSERGDFIHWLQRNGGLQERFLDQMEDLRRSLNQRLMLGLFDFEAHYAVYPQGGRYRRHLDSFRGAANRVLSVVLYLNGDWSVDDGGLLKLYQGRGKRPEAIVLPELGTMAIFLSEEIPHEVTMAKRRRLSIAGWYRLNSSTTLRADPPI